MQPCQKLQVLLFVTETTATSITITWDSGQPWARSPITSSSIAPNLPRASSRPWTPSPPLATASEDFLQTLITRSACQLLTTIGQGPPSEPVEARTGEQAPASPPRNIQARIISQNTMMVRWDEPEEPNGQIKGYRVYYTMDPSQPMSNVAHPQCTGQCDYHHSKSGGFWDLHHQSAGLHIRWRWTLLRIPFMSSASRRLVLSFIYFLVFVNLTRPLAPTVCQFECLFQCWVSKRCSMASFAIEECCDIGVKQIEFRDW